MFGKSTTKPDSPKNSRRGIRTLIGEGTQFKGSLTFEGSVRIDGVLEGEIITGGSLYIGEKAVVMADITVDSIIIYGKLSGNIVASGKVQLKRPAEIFGNIRSPVISIEEGVVFQGVCDMNRDEISFGPAPHLLESDVRMESPEDLIPALVDINEN